VDECKPLPNAMTLFSTGTSALLERRKLNLKAKLKSSS